MTVDSKELQMPSALADLLSLIEHDIPDGRQNLKDSHSNLEKVADYCESNYFQVTELCQIGFHIRADIRLLLSGRK